MNHSYFLQQALEQAIIARDKGQNPIGCVIIDGNEKIIARAHNEVNKRNDRRAHAEMLAIDEAIHSADSEEARSWTLYTTIEPCVMCFSTIIMCHIGKVVWGAKDRYMEAHKMLSSIPYLRTRKLVTIACPDPEIEKECEKIHDEYLISIGRPDATKPVIFED